MKLKSFAHLNDYHFLLTFENGEKIEVDLETLIGNHVSVDALNTARIDSEWGCLEFNDGRVDIAPKTLYQFATDQSHQVAA